MINIKKIFLNFWGFLGVSVRDLGVSGKFISLMFLLIILVFPSLVNSDENKDSLSLIEKALKDEKISFNSAIIYKTYALFAPEKLPAAYKSNFLHKCGKETLKEIKKNLHFLNDKEKNLLKPYLKLKLDVPSNLNNTYETNNFQIYYTISGADTVPLEDSNSNSYPDYVENLGQYFEESYQFITVNLGYPAAPKKNYPKYRVYLANLSAYGLSDYDGEDSIMGIDNDMNTAYANEDSEGRVKGALKVTVAHELFHIIKAAYDWEEDLWWDEATSVWIEDEIYTSVNDYFRYLPEWFSHPEYSLDTGGMHMYASVILAKYLSEKFDLGIIKKIWERCAIKGKNSLSAINEELKTRSTNFEDFFKNFTAANYLKDYKEGTSYPDIKIKNTYENPLISSESSLNHLASDYILFKSTSLQQLAIKLSGDKDLNWKVMLIKKTQSSNEIEEIILNSSQTGEKLIQSFGSDYSQIVMIANNLSENQDNKIYNYQAGFAKGIIPISPENLQINSLENQINLSWQSSLSANISGYKIYRSSNLYTNYNLLKTMGLINYYEDTEISSGVNYYYVITAFDNSLNESYASERKMAIAYTGTLSFLPGTVYNYPNPFNPLQNFCTFNFSLSKSSNTSIEIYNLAGNLVRTIFALANKGNNQILWDGKDEKGNFLPNGVYLYRIRAQNFSGKPAEFFGKSVIIK